ncbi:MAG: PAS domain S-box protein [Gammaproteobacteria bacterium]|nr:PAS domain S-box protein [Gammaproteobacteria bacterium]
MKIRDRLRVIILLPIILGVSVAAIQQWRSTHFNRTLTAQDIINTITTDIIALHHLTIEFKSPSGEKRPTDQWVTRYKSLSNILSNNTIKTADISDAIDNIRHLNDQLLQFYNDLSAVYKTKDIISTVMEQRQQEIIERMLLIVKKMESDALHLTQLQNKQSISIYKLEEKIILCVIIVMVAVLSWLALVMGRRIITPLLTLNSGMEIIGLGNLNHRIGLLSDDELGKPGLVVDKMVSQLKQSIDSGNKLNQQLIEANHELEQRTVKLQAEINAHQQAKNELEQSRKQIELAHREWEDAFDSVQDPIFLHDANGLIMRANRAYAEQANISVKDVVGRPYWQCFPLANGPLPSCQLVKKSQHIEEFDDEIRLENGDIFLSRAFTIREPCGDYRYSIHIMKNISFERQAEEALKESETRFRYLFESAPLAYQSLDKDGHLIEVNWAWEELFNYHRDEVLSQPFSNFLAEPDRSRFHDKLISFYEGKDNHDVDLTMYRKDGAIRLISLKGRISYNTDGQIEKSHFILADITERKQIESNLRSLNQMLQTTRECNEALVRATDEKTLIQQICDLLAAHGDFSLVWAGLSTYKGDIVHSTTSTSDEACDELEKLARLNTEWQDEDGLCPAKEAIKTGQIQVINDIDNDPTYSSYHKRIRNLGCFSLAALPLRNNRKSLGVLMVYSDKMNAFNQQQINLLNELVNDLAYGIVSLRLHTERNQMAQRLESNLLQTVQVIARTLETRDPYTAGHQRRTTELSVAIAQELGLDKQQIEGIRFGSTIHDIGKINVPAEILNRPGKLTKFEFEIIKSHPQVGYDIIKEVDFPWPVAQIIYQHHERLDGSGYPQGLKENEIILEAKIVAVADVMEAMSSHRPYRPGLGIDAALDEIKNNRGILYDAQVVDICLELFSSKRFLFSDIKQ